MQPLASGGRDTDALHVLPLTHMPLKTASLRKARIVKNARLEGVVELFSDSASGSGQVQPAALPQMFDFHGDNAGDPAVVERLCDLPSYDVYSLRLSLRKAGIQVDQHETLTLSEEAQRELTPYMKTFTNPLVKAVYGNDSGADKDLRDLVALFVSPDVKQARENLNRIAETLGITIADLPAFLENYGDTYLALAYYQRHMDNARPAIKAFLESTAVLKREAERGGGARAFVAACEGIESALERAASQISGILQMFKTRTEDLWHEISEAKFKAVQALIAEHQTAIGGCLCALIVKLLAWQARFPRPDVGVSKARMSFIVSEMLPGVEKMGEIRYADT